MSLTEISEAIGVPPEAPKQKRLTFSFPGKIGDALHQWPVAYWYWKQTGQKFDCWMDEQTLKPLGNLFASQPCVEEVLFKPGITSWHMGGQPWDFGLAMKDHEDRHFIHLGMRKFPTRQITLETLDQVPLNIENPRDVKSLEVGLDVVDMKIDPVFSPVGIGPNDKLDMSKWGTLPGRVVTVESLKNPPRLALHGTFMSHTSGVPGFWRFLSDHADELKEVFGPEVYFTGTAAERRRARELYPDWHTYDDGGDFLDLARFMSTCSTVIGAGSSNVVLASLLGIPCVRVHDPIGEHAKVIWSNLGENQINDTEMELRKSWPEFRDRWVIPARVG